MNNKFQLSNTFQLITLIGAFCLWQHCQPCRLWKEDAALWVLHPSANRWQTTSLPSTNRNKQLSCRGETARPSSSYFLKL